MTERYGNHGENPSSYRESRKFKEGVRVLEETSILNQQAKVIVLAVALGLKNAAELDVYSKEVVDLESVEEMFSGLGLYFYEDEQSVAAVVDYYELGEEIPLVRYLIGNTPETIGEAIKYAALPVTDHEKFGNAMDFPPTAVTAFVENKEGLLSWEEVGEKMTEEEQKFSFFRFSKEHFEEEIVWLEQIIAGVKEYAPNLYREVMEGRE
jgi:hypothetical protein